MFDLVKKFFRMFTCRDDPIPPARRLIVFLINERECRSYATYIEFPEGNKIYDIVTCEELGSIVDMEIFDVIEEDFKAYIIEPTKKE